LQVLQVMQVLQVLQVLPITDYRLLITDYHQ